MIQVSIEKIIVSANRLLPPSALIRHFFEFFSYGVLLKKSGGLADPCEKELKNIFEPLTKQQAEDVTASSQFIVRLIALRNLHKVILVNPIDVFKIRMIELQTFKDAEANKHKEMENKASSKLPKIKYVGNEIQIDTKDAYDLPKDAENKQSTSKDNEGSFDPDKEIMGEIQHDNSQQSDDLTSQNINKTEIKRKIDTDPNDEQSLPKKAKN